RDRPQDRSRTARTGISRPRSLLEALKRFHEHAHAADRLVAGAVDRFDHEDRVTITLDCDGLLEAPVGRDVGRLGVDGDDRALLGLSEDQEQVSHLLRRENRQLRRTRVARAGVGRLFEHPEAADRAPVGGNAALLDCGEPPEVRTLPRHLDARREPGSIVEIHLVGFGYEQAEAGCMDTVTGSFGHALQLALLVPRGLNYVRPVARYMERCRA